MPATVLIVEEYTDLCSAIAATLTRGEYTCSSATTVEEAIDKLQAQHYDSILLAPRLPIQDDPVMHFLHEQQPDEVCKVILMTEPEIEEIEAQECPILQKPFNHEQLFARLRGN
ncbi:MAG TPA: response regulator [Thermoanaerobaculia bacterium]